MHKWWVKKVCGWEYFEGIFMEEILDIVTFGYSIFTASKSISLTSTLENSIKSNE